MQATKLVYIGLHPQTLVWLNDGPCTVRATSKLDFFYRFTINPSNLLFQAIYHLHTNQQLSFLTRLLFLLWRFARPLGTGVYRKYASYLDVLITSNIRVLDTDNPRSIRDFIEQEGVHSIVINLWSLLPPILTDIPGCPAINIHPSKLPQYKGALPTLWSLKNKDTTSGVTFLVINNSPDGGDILAQYEFPIDPEDSALDIEKKVDAILEYHLVEDVQKFRAGTIGLRAQKGTESFTGKYQQYREIDWENETAREIVNKVRLYPYLEPFLFCYTRLRGSTIMIRGGDIASTSDHLQPGEFKRKGKTLTIGTREGAVTMRLLKDVSIGASLRFLLRTRGKWHAGVITFR